MKNTYILLSCILASLVVSFFISQPIPILNKSFNHLANRPPMGWNGWNAFRCENAEENRIRRAALTMVQNGMKDAGYIYVNIDDCWQAGRNRSGEIQVDEARFPSGIKSLSDYIHSLGLKFGIYTSAGKTTCEGREGSLGHELQDLQTYEEWGVDFVKVDWCGIDYLNDQEQFSVWRDAFKSIDRPIVFSVAIANKGDHKPWLWGPDVANQWRIEDDIRNNWEDVLRIALADRSLAQYSGPGTWNDADMLVMGMEDMQAEEYRTHFSLWSMLNSPLIVGSDVEGISKPHLKMLLNKDIIALNQDPLGIQASPMRRDDHFIYWSKKLLLPGQYAVAITNIDEVSHRAEFRFNELGLYDIAYVQNLWFRDDTRHALRSYTAIVAPHSTAVYKVWGVPMMNAALLQKSTLRLRTGYLSDQEWIATENGHGPVEKDMSNGEEKTGDGQPLRFSDGEEFKKGLGVHAQSNIHYYMNKRCSTFKSIIGVDAETDDDRLKVIFRVLGDGDTLYESPPLSLNSPPIHIAVDVTNHNSLNLVVQSTIRDHTEKRHGDWANAFIQCN